MGQQKTVVAASSALRRMILALLVAALMAAMMAASAMPAMAKNDKGAEGGKPSHNFGGGANSAAVFHSDRGAIVFPHGNAGGDGIAGHSN